MSELTEQPGLDLYAPAELDRIDAIAAAAEAEMTEWPSRARQLYLQLITPPIVRHLVAMARLVPPRAAAQPSQAPAQDPDA